MIEGRLDTTDTRMSLSLGLLHFQVTNFEGPGTVFRSQETQIRLFAPPFREYKRHKREAQDRYRSGRDVTTRYLCAFE